MLLCELIISTHFLFSLPPTAATDGGAVASRPAATTTTATSATSTATTVATATSSTAVASHLSQTWVNLLLSLGEDVHEVTRLLGVCAVCQ